MLKRVFSLVLALSAAVFLTGMGGKGGGFERAPRVDKNIAVTIVDTSGQSIDGEKFSCEGRTRFSGHLGLADVNLPFERVKEITMGEKHDRKIRLNARLLDGSETSLDMDPDVRCFGEANFGTFMLLMDEIKSISFKGVR